MTDCFEDIFRHLHGSAAIDGASSPRRRRSVLLISPILALLGTAIATPLPAQQAPIAQPRLRDILPPLPPLDEAAAGPALAVPAGTPGAAVPLRQAGPAFTLRAVEFDGNTVFTDEELVRLAADLLGTPVQAEELETLRLRITRHYVDAGYVNSGALLPDQTVRDGRVRFEIVEGTLDEIEVTGAEHLRPFYLRERLERSAGPPLNVEEVQRRLRLLLDDPVIRRIDAELTPGLRRGEGRIRVEVEEEPTVGLVLGADNALQPSVGGEQVGATMLVRGLTGFGEILSVSPSWGEGFQEVSGALDVPITTWDTRLVGRALYSQSEIVEEPFDLIDIESRSHELGLWLYQPVYREPGRTLTAGLGFDYRENETFLLDEPFSFSPGADDGRTVVSAVRGSGEWVDRSRDQVIAARAITSVGVDLFDATINPGAVPDSRFFSVLAQGQWVRRLASDIRFILRGDGQWTEDRLLPQERFTVGGSNTVRGYREDLQVGDRGWSASLEVQVPILETPAFLPGDEGRGGQLMLAPFVDAGRAWSVDDSANETLLSVGAGLAWEASDDVQAALYFGRGLMNRPDPFDEDIQDLGIHFSVSSTLF